MKNKPQNNPQKKVTKIVLVDAFTLSFNLDTLGPVIKGEACNVIVHNVQDP